jgi:hypothetical protein
MRSMHPRTFVAVALAWIVAGCQARETEQAASTTPAPAPAAETTSDQSLSLVIARNATKLMGIPGVVGVYEGQSEGKPVLRVMVLSRADSTMEKIPKTLEGYDVEVEVSGPVKPMNH